MRLDFTPMNRVTMWEALIAEEPPLQSLKLASNGNTDPNEEQLYIPKELYGSWNTCENDSFPDYKGIQQYATDAGAWEFLQMNINNEDYPSVVSTAAIPLVSEIAVEIGLKTHFDIVNLALKKTCSSGTSVILANGKAAIKNIHTDKTIHIEPDRASFRYNWHSDKMHLDEKDPDEDNHEEDDPDKSQRYYPCYCVCDYDKNKLNDNLVPGEVKVAYKFQMKFINATKMDRRFVQVPVADSKSVEEAEKVFTQIYQYMNDLGAHYGYVITDQELICIRRRNSSDYGAMDLTSSIPLCVEEGKLNAKLALWYLHHKYIIRDPTQTKMPTTPKGADWPDYVDTIKFKRKTRENAEFEEACKRARYEKSRENKRSRTNLRSDSKYGNSSSNYSS